MKGLEKNLIEIISSSFELEVSYKGLISIVKDQSQWKVKYETYFNPHANPKQLMDILLFDNAIDAANFFLDQVKKFNQQEE